PTVGERDPDRLRIFHDVVVGQDVAVLTDDEAGAAAALYAWGGHRLAPEEILEGKALERNRLAHLARSRFHFDIDHAGEGCAAGLPERLSQHFRARRRRLGIEIADSFVRRL